MSSLIERKVGVQSGGEFQPHAKHAPLLMKAMIFLSE